MRKIPLLLIPLLLFLGGAKKDESPVIRTSYGLVRGITTGPVSSFKGIPYAAPPVAEYRWRPPQPISAWEGELDATQYGPNCAQAGWPRNSNTIADGSAEDCLYLNLWAPNGATPAAKLPVMVWIHGGGFVGGSGSSPGDAGMQFAEKGVILLTFNYRLGRLGFFAFPGLNDAYPDEPKGNYGYMDQIAALRWVQENISAFGGDPNNVTIFGFSAGGVSVHSLMTIPDASGLFHKAISQSGGGRDGVLTARPLREENVDPFYPESAEQTGINFAKKLGIEGTNAAAVAKLRALSVSEIVDGGQETDGEEGPRTYAGPILDGRLVVETAEQAYRDGRQMKIPLLIGSNSAEIGGAFVNTSQSTEALFSLFGTLEADAKAAYDPDDDKSFEEVISLFNTDWVWAEPARFTAKTFAKSGASTFLYQFGYVPDTMKEWMPFGAGHGAEVLYVFDNLDSRRRGPKPTSKDRQVAQIMNAYWANFAKTGNPNGDGLPDWPGFTSEKEEILDIQRDGIPVGKPDPRKARLDLIESASMLRNQLQSRGI